MTDLRKEMAGLSQAQAGRLQEQYGKNELTPQKKENFLKKVFHIICEPMFLLLIVAAIIYFILGEPGDGAVMLIFVAAIISIDVIQEWKTDRTLNVLKCLAAPQIRVIRDNEERTIASTELVPGDLMIICEGVRIPADGVILKCSDLCVDESTLTGEADSVWKVCRSERIEQEEGDPGAAHTENSENYWRKDNCYAGTLVIQGSAAVRVERTGAATEYGKIGKGVADAAEEPTPLQKQTGILVRVCAAIAVFLFLLVALFTYLDIPDHGIKERLTESILSGVTLAMAMIPEEFPVILTVFLSMGAWRLAKKNALVRRLPSVETLGAVSVLCADKTGTITMNEMKVQDIWSGGTDERKLIEVMGLGCETDAYDPMEKAMLRYCREKGITAEELFKGALITEYAFTNEFKMMGHVWKQDGAIIIAAKGSPEKILTICDMEQSSRKTVEENIHRMSKEGLRVIAVAVMRPETEQDIPETLADGRFTLLGLVGLADPPRESIKEDITLCSRAGIRVVMITGDNGITASSIAGKIGMKNCDHIITGDMLDGMSDGELREKVKNVSIFSRVVPEHKMRIVKALKQGGEVVAMTGDGVNDAPALKYADIGIAMGKRGSEVSREAADLILLDDNFTVIMETVKDGRRIYDNIRKAVGYIFTIHIPIALSSLLAPLLGIAPSSFMLLPLHIVLMELVIDPTCSVVLERQPAERDIMDRRPRDPAEKLLTASVLGKSVLQGFVLFAASFGTYYYMLQIGGSAPEAAPVARAMGLAIIILGNLFLVEVNSSDHESAFRSLMQLARDKVMWLVPAGTILMLAVVLYSPLHVFMKLGALSASQLLGAVIIAAVSVFWYEAVKLLKRITAEVK